jgi:hypothetical protein
MTWPLSAEEYAETKARLDAAGVLGGRVRRYCLEGPDALKMSVDDVYRAMGAQGLRPLTPSAKNTAARLEGGHRA